VARPVLPATRLKPGHPLAKREITAPPRPGSAPRRPPCVSGLWAGQQGGIPIGGPCSAARRAVSSSRPAPHRLTARHRRPASRRTREYRRVMISFNAIQLLIASDGPGPRIGGTRHPPLWSRVPHRPASRPSSMETSWPGGNVMARLVRATCRATVSGSGSPDDPPTLDRGRAMTFPLNVGRLGTHHRSDERWLRGRSLGVC
jgi:hypothetical protein